MLTVQKKLSFLLLVGVVVFAFVALSGNAYADDPCKDIQDLDDRASCYEKEIEKNEKKYESTSKKLSDIRSQKDSVTQKIGNLLSELNVTQSELSGIQAEIDTMNAQLDEINENLEDRTGRLSEKVKLRNTVLRNYSKRGLLSDIETFISSNNLGLNGFQFSTANYIFQKKLNEESVRLIKALNTEISNFTKDKSEAEELKDELEDAQAQLVAAKSHLENAKNSEEGNLNSLSDKEGNYEDDLQDITKKINELSSKQQEILAKKAGEGSSSLGSYESPKWSVPKPPFSPAFAAFSYGAYTHYNGMSQYGAKGRAEDGQDYEDIIKFYFKEKPKGKDDLPSKISVEGYGEMDFQKYLYGLGEMPSDWPMEALKAQAVAARSYAYRYIKAGKTICTSQSCQVFVKSKSDNPPSRWKEAVDDTRGEIIGGDTGASGYGWYSSTTGGYINNIGWDVDGSWPGDSYEKKTGSPWFYWAWYSESYRFDSSTCGRSHPWLNEEEMADILNAWVLYKNGDKGHISPVTTSCWGGDPYSMDKMADKAGKYGEEYKSVSDVDVDIGSDGKTKTVTFQTNRGKVSINGDEFKSVFNLRAPGYISIRSRLFELKKE